MDNVGELNVKVRTERHGKGDSSRMTFQGGKVRKLLLAVSGVVDKGSIVVFDGSGSFILPKLVCRCRVWEKGHHRSSRTLMEHAWTEYRLHRVPRVPWPRVI